MGIVSMILGISSILIGLVFFLYAVPIAISGFILGIKGRKTDDNKGMATAGIVLSGIGILFPFILIFWGLVVMA